MVLNRHKALVCGCALLLGMSTGLWAQEQADAAERQGGFAGQEAPAAAVANDGGQAAEQPSVTINGHVIRYLWPGHEAALFGEDGSGRWRHFMHGLTDERAQAFDWTPLLTEEQQDWLSSERVRTDVMYSELYSLSLKGGTDVTLSQPIVDLGTLGSRQGGMVRVYLWIRGENTGEGGTLWESAPQATLILKDSYGEEKARAEGQFRTRGTFPWFCYHLEVRVPADFTNIGDTGANGGLFLRLANPASGTAWFATPSYEILDAAQAKADSGVSRDTWADPRLGTFAPNPDYDELPLHFLFGLPAERHVKWNFIAGNNQMHDLTMAYDMEKLIDGNKNDWFYMTQAFPSLLFLYQTGMQAGRTPAFQEKWAERLVTKLATLQNPETGLWTVAGHDNLYVTYLIASQCFAPERQHRANEAVTKTPWLSVGDRTLPNAPQLVRSLLAAQMVREGVRAGWNKYAFQGEDMLAASRDAWMMDMRYTAAAVRLLTQCEPLVSAAQAKEIRAAVCDAWLFATANVIGSNWLWYENETRRSLFLSPLAFTFVEGCQAIDTKTDFQGVEKPAVNVTFPDDHRATLRVAKLPPNAVSLRVYELTTGKKDSQVTDDELKAIIRLADLVPEQCDPLLVVKQFCNAQADDKLARPLTAADAGAADIVAKLRQLEKVNAMKLNEQNQVSFPVRHYADGSRLAVMAADRYGHLSPAVTFAVTPLALDEKPAPAAKPAAPAAN